MSVSVMACASTPADVAHRPAAPAVNDAANARRPIHLSTMPSTVRYSVSII